MVIIYLQVYLWLHEVSYSSTETWENWILNSKMHKVFVGVLKNNTSITESIEYFTNTMLKEKVINISVTGNLNLYTIGNPMYFPVNGYNIFTSIPLVLENIGSSNDLQSWIGWAVSGIQIVSGIGLVFVPSEQGFGAMMITGGAIVIGLGAAVIIGVAGAIAIIWLSDKIDDLWGDIKKKLIG